MHIFRNSSNPLNLLLNIVACYKRWHGLVPWKIPKATQNIGVASWSNWHKLIYFEKIFQFASLLCFFGTFLVIFNIFLWHASSCWLAEQSWPSITRYTIFAISCLYYLRNINLASKIQVNMLMCDNLLERIRILSSHFNLLQDIVATKGRRLVPVHSPKATSSEVGP